ncbi:hypothetical protein [Francisella sp. SYW-9]|uniref:hypothetical protein n=1 Tax=Francisella sp. SYW-9 TaxID=2610888 RepID=UPI00123C9D2B|nr:hypothetical protein [Francisella sp. SYW-9]
MNPVDQEIQRLQDNLKIVQDQLKDLRANNITEYHYGDKGATRRSLEELRKDESYLQGKINQLIRSKAGQSNIFLGSYRIR